jgi:hypothetical protein
MLTSALLLAAAVYANGQPPPAAAVKAEFDCAMRALAVDYALSLQPFRSPTVFSDIADALNGTPEKAPGCTVNASAAMAAAAGVPSRFPHFGAPARAPGAGGQTFYVATTGSDAAAGTLAAPFATLTRAVAASRATPGADTILLRGGTYYSQPTIVLLPQDSGLTIQNFPSEEVWLSGSAPLPAGAVWRPYNVSNSTPPAPPTPTWHVAQGTTDVYANAGGAYVKGKTPTWQACEALCQADGTCKAWTWHDAAQGSYALQCFFRPDGVWAPQPEEGHVAGYFGADPAPTLPNIWAMDLSAAGVAGVAGLRAADGTRLTRARYPNGFPETRGFMPPAVFRATSWTPQQAPRTPAVQVDLPRSVLLRNTSVSSFQTFTAGLGGTCERFDPDSGYWCSTHVQGGGSVIYFAPIAMQATQAVLPHTPYAHPETAIIQTWRPGHWASWMYEVGAATFDPATGATNFSLARGGFQGSRGADEGEDSYIENVFEELDAPSEWFFDASTSTLYLFHNATAGTPPPPALLWTPPANKHLFNITGTAASPVRGVSLLGLGLRDTAYTYMDPHAIPSGGDWTLERSAVVFIEGTEGVNVSGCVFERIDGNAVVLSAYNRHAEVSFNEFAWIGATAVALWGNTESTGGADSVLAEGYGADGTSGNQPRFSLIAHNLCRELGVWEKQSSCYTQFKSAQNTVLRNIFYNGPRAHINFNDGFGGGAVVESNLVFNSCRESSDHGPFNSWDRDPYLFIDPVSGQVTTVKLYDEIRYNFIIANYNSLGA